GVLALVPCGVVTSIGPTPAVGGTFATIDVAVAETICASSPAKVTPVAPARPEPVIVTFVPAGAEAGEKLPKVGSIENESERAVVPPPFVTDRAPSRALVGAVAV